MVTKQDNSHDGGTNVAAMAELIEPLSPNQIEKLAIEAIREHRSWLEKSEIAFAALEKAETIRPDTADELREAYTRIMLSARAHQMVLATLIERLGFIPHVPPD